MNICLPEFIVYIHKLACVCVQLLGNKYLPGESFDVNNLL